MMAAASPTDPKDLPPEDPQAIYDQAVNLCLDGKDPEARALLERLVVLAIDEEAFGPQHREVGATLNSLGVVAREQGELTAARRFFERALSIHEASLGANHPEFASALNNLALVMESQGELDAAKAMYQRALSITEAALGPNHPSVAAPLSNLAILLRQQGEHAEAKALMKRARDYAGQGASPRGQYQSQCPPHRPRKGAQRVRPT